MSRVASMTSLSSTTRVGSLTSILQMGKEQWISAQVELHGEFPFEHIQRFDDYVARTSWWRALLVCLWTPVPIIVIVAAIDLIHLEDPKTHTARESPNTYLRTVFTFMITSFCYLEQFRQHIPGLQLPRRYDPVISVVCSIPPVVLLFVLGDKVAYPFPFSVNVSSMPWVHLLVGAMLIVARHQLRANTQLVRAARRHSIVCVCQLFMVAVYPAYMAVFVRVSSWGQTAMVLLLSLIKLACKNWISRWIANTDEARSESVIFNVEVFHSLYVSFAMQNSTAIHTIAAIMAVDFANAWLSFRDILEVVERLSPLTSRLATGSVHFLPVVNRLVEIEKFASTPRVSLIKDSRQKKASGGSHLRLPLITRVVPANPSSPRITLQPDRGQGSPSMASLASMVNTFSDEDRSVLVRQTQKLLFITDFVSLVEYTEVLMPCIFNMCMLVMYSLPNRPYYSFLRHVSIDELRIQIMNVFLYGSMEFISLVIMAVILWRKLRLSLLHQIAFVLETRQASIQSKMIMWTIAVLQGVVEQSGVDYTFQFAWIKSRETAV